MSEFQLIAFREVGDPGDKLSDNLIAQRYVPHEPTLVGIIESYSPLKFTNFAYVVEERPADQHIPIQFGVMLADQIAEGRHRDRMFGQSADVVVVKPFTGRRIDIALEQIDVGSEESQEFEKELVFDSRGDRIEIIPESIGSALDNREQVGKLVLVVLCRPDSHHSQLRPVAVSPDLSPYLDHVRAADLCESISGLFPQDGIDLPGCILQGHLQHFTAVVLLQFVTGEHEEVGYCIPQNEIFDHVWPPGVQGNAGTIRWQGKCLSKLLNLFSLAEMRILSRYILKEHLGPFLFAFFVVTFVLILDFVPSVIDMAIGKNLDFLTILWVFILNLAWMLALSIPMSTLVATLMAFGRMTSDMEVLAIKSSGIHLMQILRPVLISSVLLASFLVWFNNEVLPDANHKARILMSDIRVMRPTLSIRSNVFLSDIPGYVILISDIDHTTSRIKDVTIFDQKDPQNPRLILAEGGKLEYLENGNVLSFQLEEGETHEPVKGEGNKWQWVQFEKQTVNIRDVDRSLQRTSSEYRGDRELSSEAMLEETRKWQENIDRTQRAVSRRIETEVRRLLYGETRDKPAEEEMFYRKAINLAYQQASQMSRFLDQSIKSRDRTEKMKNTYLLEVHKKYSLPAACIVFILIGAPLGILARKGGMSVSIGISIGLFIIYWAFLIGGEELSDRGFISPVVAMWSANVLIAAVGLVLLYKVMAEKRLLEVVGLTGRK